MMFHVARSHTRIARATEALRSSTGITSRFLSSEAAKSSPSTNKGVDPSYYVKDETGMSPFVREQRRQKRLHPEKFEKPVFYAVRKGREVGVFQGWEKAKGKVLGFSGAHFKPFRKLEKAEAWLAAEEASLPDNQKLTPKQPPKEAVETKPNRLQLNFSAATLNGANGFPEKIGLGWILRQQPNNQVVLAGCDVFDLDKWKQAHPAGKNFKPVLSRELPMLSALHMALGEITKYYKTESATPVPAKSEEKVGTEKDSTQTPAAPVAPKKVDLPLIIKSDHAYTVGLLSGAKPLVAEFADDVTAAKEKVLATFAQSEIAKVEPKDNVLAIILAKAAIDRKSPRLVVDGQGKTIKLEELKTMFTESQ